MEYELTSELLGAAAGAVVSWIFSYTPKLNERYKKKTPGQKRLIMVLAMVVVSLAVYGLSCANSPFNFGVTCDEAGAWKLGAILFFAVVGNQVTYLLSPKKAGVKSVVYDADPDNGIYFVEVKDGGKVIAKGPVSGREAA